MMLSKLTMSTTSISLNLSNYKRKRPSSFVSNIGPLLQRIKRSFNPNINSSTARRSNTVHCCLNDYQETSEKCALSASLIEERDEDDRLSWSQETFICAARSDSEPSKIYAKHVENWWSTTPSIHSSSTNAVL